MKRFGSVYHQQAINVPSGKIPSNRKVVFYKLQTRVIEQNIFVEYHDKGFMQEIYDSQKTVIVFRVINISIPMTDLCHESCT